MSENIRGFAFPFKIDPESGGITASSGSDKLKENIKHLILTAAGERVMERSYGGGLWQLLSDTSNLALRAIVQHQITKTITKFEPRVAVQEVVVTEEGRGGEVLMVNIRYVDRVAQSEEHLSVQFGLGAL